RIHQQQDPAIGETAPIDSEQLRPALGVVVEVGLKLAPLGCPGRVMELPQPAYCLALSVSHRLVENLQHAFDNLCLTLFVLAVRHSVAPLQIGVQPAVERTRFGGPRLRVAATVVGPATDDLESLQFGIVSRMLEEPTQAVQIDDARQAYVVAKLALGERPV